MHDRNALEQLAPITAEMLGGLHADDAMRRRVLSAARGQSAPRRVRMLAPALCCAALAVVCVVGVQMRRTPATVQIQTIAAGGDVLQTPATVAALDAGANVRAAAPRAQSLFAAGQGDIPLVTVNGAVYRLLETPGDMGASLLGNPVGQVTTIAQEPSLASADALAAGLSNVAAEGSAVYAVRGLSTSTAVAAEVNGHMRLFQRVSYAGHGPSGESLADTFAVRGQVKALALSDVGTLEGDAAEQAMAVLLDNAVLKAADMAANGQTLTVTLKNGLKLQLGVSGDTVCGCGGWSCPEFFEAFEAAL